MKVVLPNEEESSFASSRWSQLVLVPLTYGQGLFVGRGSAWCGFPVNLLDDVKQKIHMHSCLLVCRFRDHLCVCVWRKHDEERLGVVDLTMGERAPRTAAAR